MMKNRRNSKITTLLCVFMAGAMVLGGCGKQEEIPVNNSEGIELLEPVGTTAAYEEVAYRNIYKSRVYSATVFPYTVEYSFGVSGDVETINKMPGEEVKKKTTLAKLNMDSLEKQIEAKEEYIADMEENYLQTKANTEEYIVSKQSDLDYYKWGRDAYANVEPAAFVPGAGYESAPTTDPDYATWKAEYDAWQREFDKWNGNFRILEHDLNMRKESLAQTTALYELDLAYQNLC